MEDLEEDVDGDLLPNDPVGDTVSEVKNPINIYFISEGHYRVCKACRSKISAKTGTTTAAINHLKRKHMSDFKAYEVKKAEWLQKRCKLAPQSKPSQPTIKSAFQMQSTWPATNPQATQLTNQIGKFIVGGFHSYSIVEETEFRGLLRLASPRYQVPSRTTFSRNIIPKMHENLCKKIKSDLQNLKDLQSWSFTTDCWTSRKNDSYISFTTHFLTEDYKIKCYCLALKRLSVQHTGANICNAIKDIIIEWEIPHEPPTRIYAVTDTAANMKSAISISKSWTHIPCFGHMLQLCVEDSIKETVKVSHLMAKCRSIVGHYSRSPGANARLHAAQEQLGQTPLELIQDVQTRWNSQYFMLERLIRCRNAINLELGTSSSQISTLKGTEWALAEEVVKIFEPLVEATQFSSGETYPTISAVLPMLLGIEMVFGEMEETQFGQSILKNLKSRFGTLETNCIYVLSTLMDPKYKLTGLKQELHSTAREYLREELNAQPQAASSKAESTEEDVAPCTSRSIFKYLEEKTSAKQDTEDDEVEINMYLKAPNIKHSECSLTWWRENQHRFTKLSKIARKHLGIPATSVPSERLFSSAGNVVSTRRKELLPEHAEQLVVLHDNIKHVT